MAAVDLSLEKPFEHQVAYHLQPCVAEQGRHLIQIKAVAELLVGQVRKLIISSSQCASSALWPDQSLQTR